MKPLGFVAVLHRAGVEETVLPCFLQAAQSQGKQGQAGLLLQHWPGVMSALQRRWLAQNPSLGSLYLLCACVLHKEKPQRLKISV